MIQPQYNLNHAVFDAVDFLRDYWQQQPIVIRNAFLGFEDPISPDELAGLAMELGVDSRIISQKNSAWHVEHGPFEQFDSLPASHWTLLVQAVNEHVPVANELLRAFRFLPDWRIDDLMVSYSTPHGGVGSHVDQYDVFIIQGQGRRRWQVGKKEPLKTLLPHPDLKQTEPFNPIIDEVLEPGDMVYIPAGFPHCGASEQASLNYSVGFRAPSQSELLTALADFAADRDIFQTRFRDHLNDLFNGDGTDLPDREPWHFAREHAIRFTTLLREALEDDAVMHEMLAEFLSKNPRPPLPEWPERPITESTIAFELKKYPLLFKAIGVRMITAERAGRKHAVVQGQWYVLDDDAEALFGVLCDMSDCLESYVLGDFIQSPAARTLLCGLLNEGLFVLGTDAESDTHEDRS